MLRQFHTQQIEIGLLLDKFTNKYTELVDEVKQLRQDYRELKHIY
jgi:hypothetical protein